MGSNTVAVAVSIASLLIYYLSLFTYRLYGSPIAGIPGPKLAALTFWYEFYYDVVKRGRYEWIIRDMHDRYGNSQCS